MKLSMSESKNSEQHEPHLSKSAAGALDTSNNLIIINKYERNFSKKKEENKRKE
jgi:hypothetical protein